MRPAPPAIGGAHDRGRDERRARAPCRSRRAAPPGAGRPGRAGRSCADDGDARRRAPAARSPSRGRSTSIPGIASSLSSGAAGVAPGRARPSWRRARRGRRRAARRRSGWCRRPRRWCSRRRSDRSVPSSRRSPEADQRPRSSAWRARRPRPRTHASHAPGGHAASRPTVPSSQERTKDSTLSASTGSPLRLRSTTSTGASGTATIARHSTPGAPWPDRTSGRLRKPLVGCARASPRRQQPPRSRRAPLGAGAAAAAPRPGDDRTRHHDRPRRHGAAHARLAAPAEPSSRPSRATPASWWA